MLDSLVLLGRSRSDYQPVMYIVFGLFLIKIASTSLAGVTVNDAQEEESQNWQTVQVCEFRRIYPA